MKRELDYFRIEGGLGWNQHWFADRWMYFGGCAAVTACDLSIYLARTKGIRQLYPYDPDNLTREDYLAFAKTMKGYLGPRLTGIDTLELYSSGLRTYWQDVGAGSLTLAHAEGTLPWLEAGELIRERIDSGLIVPFLLLRHQNRALKDYHWHWFNLAGYDERQGGLKVKVVTYGSFRWLDFRELWETGHRRKGGFIRVFTPGMG